MRSMLICASLALPFQMRQRNRSTSVMIIAFAPRAGSSCDSTPATCFRDRREIGGATVVGYIRACSLTEGGCVAWVLRLVEIGAEGEGSCADVVEISRPNGLVDIADLGLTLAEAKLVLAGVQREIVAAPGRGHPGRRAGGPRWAGGCRGEGDRPR